MLLTSSCTLIKCYILYTEAVIYWFPNIKSMIPFTLHPKIQSDEHEMFKSQFSMCQMSSVHSGTHARPLSVFEYQVWEDHCCWMLSWLWAGWVAPAGGLGPGPGRGGTIREAPAAGRCAPAHQTGARLPGQSPLLPLYDLRPHPATRGSWPEGCEESLLVKQVLCRKCKGMFSVFISQAAEFGSWTRSGSRNSSVP